ncbi:MAG: YdcF family protein, partial [Candidatus Magasanikbacteria bacterium]|nr:YdcF family protein [Candidatus Magasanikbacteria bacterium]
MYSHTEIVAVMGYGCHLTPVLKEYLDLVVSYAKSNPHSIIFCTGGFTNQKTAPGVSEAGLMAEYLRQQGVNNYIIKEDTAKTTTENLRNLRQYAALRIDSLERVVIFCDSCRSLKIRLIFHHFFGFWPEISSFDIAQRWQAK